LDIAGTVSHAPGVCASCGRPLAGPFCSQCGEEAIDPHAQTVRHFVAHTLAEETLHPDGRFWRTLVALSARPGFLSAEYCAGRRRRYISPVKLLATAILAYALLTGGGLRMSLHLGTLTLSIAPTKITPGMTVVNTVRGLERFGALEPLLAAKRQSVNLEAESVREKFHRKLEAFAEPLSFTNVLLMTLALYFLFHRRRALLVSHAVFSMHLVSFVLLSSLLFLPGIWILARNEAVALTYFLVVLVWQFAYIATAIGRFYFVEDPRKLRRRATAIAAALVVYLLNSVFVTAVQMVGAAYALWSL
jgi:uncharacterized protein DUF3667